MATFESHANVSDFEDDEDEEFVLPNEPYLYEPEYTDEELREMDAQRAERERESVEATTWCPERSALLCLLFGAVLLTGAK